MDFKELTPEQRRACVRLIGVIWNRTLAVNDSDEFEGQAKIAVAYAYRQYEQVITTVMSELEQSYPPPYT